MLPYRRPPTEPSTLCHYTLPDNCISDSVDDLCASSTNFTSKGEHIPCQFVGLTAGVRPNIDFLKKSGIDTDKGVLINEYFETNIPDVYAIGDCSEFKIAIPGQRSIEQVWYTGRMHGETVAETICGNRKAYNPGPWFNSAKFFDSCLLLPISTSFKIGTCLNPPCE